MPPRTRATRATRATPARPSRATGRGPGQPPLSELGGPARAMPIKVPVELYDEVKVAARRAGISISQWARAALRRSVAVAAARGRRSRQNGR